MPLDAWYVHKCQAVWFHSHGSTTQRRIPTLHTICQTSSMRKSPQAIGFVFGLGKLEWLGYNLVKVACWSTQLFGHNTSTWQTNIQTDSHVTIGNAALKPVLKFCNKNGGIKRRTCKVVVQHVYSRTDDGTASGTWSEPACYMHPATCHTAAPLT